MYITKETKAVLDALQLQIQAQWHRPPLQHASVHTAFCVTNDRQDLDNMHQCVLDLLVKSKVLKDDKIACVARLSSEAVLGDEESVEIILEELAP